MAVSCREHPRSLGDVNTKHHPGSFCGQVRTLRGNDVLVESSRIKMSMQQGWEVNASAKENVLARS